MTSAQALWFASRGTGVVSLLLLTASLLLGIVTSVRFETPRWPRFITEGLHRNISLLILMFLALHIATTVIDGFAPIGYLDAIIPFSSPYRTMWLGFGAVAFDLLIALAITSIVRVRLGYKMWRAVHWLSYLCWPIAIMHGLGTGSDARTTWMLVITVAAVAAVLAAAGWRLTTSWVPESPQRRAAVTALVVVPLAIGLWARSGPLQANWSHSFKHPKPSTHTTGNIRTGLADDRKAGT